MELCYGDKNHIRMLEEAAFWKRQETEHTVVIREITGGPEKEYADVLREYQRILSGTEAAVLQQIESLNRSCFSLDAGITAQIREMIEVTQRQSKTFVAFLDRMVKKSEAVRKNSTAPVVIAHIIRESGYYIAIAGAYLARAGQDT